MKTFFTVTGLLIAGLLIIAGCESSSTAVDESPQDLLSLIRQLETPGESLITSNRSVFVSEFEPSDIGRLPNGIHWGFLTREDTHTLRLGLAFGSISRSGSPSEQGGCSDRLHIEERWRPESPEAICGLCESLHNHCDGAWIWTEENGEAHANGHNLVVNSMGEVALVDYDLPDDG